jgi:hypothetical protein
MAVQRVAVTAGLAAGAVGLAVAATGGPAQEPVATPSGDVAQLLDIDVDQLAGTLMLIAADRLAADPVQLGQATDAAADQHGMHRGGSQPDLRSDLGRSQSLGPAEMDDPTHHRRRVRRGLEWDGWTDRPSRPLPGRGSGWPIDARLAG